MVLLTLFLLAGIDQSINPKSRQTIGKRVKFGFTQEELGRLTRPIRLDKGQTGLGLRKRKRNGRRTLTF